MDTILILADFSDTCNNALKYAANLSKAVDAKRIILLKSHYTSVYSQLLPSADFVQLNAADIDDEVRKEDDLLKEMVQRLYGDCNATLQVDVVHSQEPLLRAMRNVIASHQPNLVLLGSDKLTDEGSTVGQQVVEVVKVSPVPVLVIPPGAVRNPLKNVLVPADFKALERLSVLSQLQGLKLAANPELLILNVDPDNKHQNQEAEATQAVKTFLESYQYKVYYSHNRDTVKGILDFAAQHDVQLIVALPGKHSFFYNLTHSSITEALTVNSQLPVLILK